MAETRDTDVQAASSACPTRKVLVVDDEPAIVHVLVHALQTRGYDAVPAGHWADAVDNLERERPDLLLLDLAMPHVDGWSLFDFLRKQGCDVPVIVISAHISDEVAASLRSQGVSALIWKPFEVADVLAEVDRVIGPAILAQRDPLSDAPEHLTTVDEVVPLPLELGGDAVAAVPHAPAEQSVDTPGVQPAWGRNSGSRRRYVRRARTSRRRMVTYMGYIALICLLFAGVLAALRAYTGSLTLDAVRSSIAQSISRQHQENDGRSAHR